MSLQHRKLSHHSLGLGQLIPAAVRHEHGTCTDGTVKTLHQPLLGAHVQIGKHAQPFFPDVSHICLIKQVACPVWNLQGHVRLLMCPVGVQEGPAQIHNGLAAPVHLKPWLLCHHCHGHCLQVFLCSIPKEPVNILWIHHHCHTLLGLGNGYLRAVQARIFLGNLVQINLKAGSQLSDGYRYAACAEVIALLDDSADLRPAEHPLNLALCGRISLLYLSPAYLDGGSGVNLGGTGGAADSVAARTPAQKNDDIPRIRGLADNILSGSSAHNSADFHSLCNIAGMIDLLHITGCQTNLVAVGGISLGCAVNNLSLGQLAFKRLPKRPGGIGRAGNAHSLVHIGTP